MHSTRTSMAIKDQPGSNSALACEIQVCKIFHTYFFPLFPFSPPLPSIPRPRSSVTQSHARDRSYATVRGCRWRVDSRVHDVARTQSPAPCKNERTTGRRSSNSRIGAWNASNAPVCRPLPSLKFGKTRRRGLPSTCRVVIFLLTIG